MRPFAEKLRYTPQSEAPRRIATGLLSVNSVWQIGCCQVLRGDWEPAASQIWRERECGIPVFSFLLAFALKVGGHDAGRSRRTLDTASVETTNRLIAVAVLP